MGIRRYEVSAAQWETIALFARQGGEPWADGVGQPPVREPLPVGAALRCPLVRPARAVWPLEERASALQPVVPRQGVGARVCDADR